MDNRKIGELVLLIGIALFVGGAVGLITGYLSQDQTPQIGALALLFVVIGASMKKVKK
ncbi:MAG: hypothetical protein IBX40_12670 [Methanosarcinales archaeon]|nr:hypothetical protein [Methanosarcinales archaeon]